MGEKSKHRGTDMVESYPLYWPEGWQRTPAAQRKFGRFAMGFAAARDGLIGELKRMGATDVVLSTNVPVRRDGLPYATHAQPEDSGAAVYFMRAGRALCFACDRFSLVKDNLNAIRLTVEALRGIERWAASDLLERAFVGFAALPGVASDLRWREVLGFAADNNITPEMIDARFRELAHTHHPDKGGDPERFRAVLAAREMAHAEVQL